MKNFKVMVLIILITSFIFNLPIEVLALQNSKEKSNDEIIAEICDKVRNSSSG